MKDRLNQLRSISSRFAGEEAMPEENFGSAPEDGNHLELHEFDGEDVMNDIFKEAHIMRKELMLFKRDVRLLEKQNTRLLTSVRRFSSIKRDANAIGRDIKTRGEAIYARLEMLGKLSKNLEEEQGSSSTLVRLARSQHVCLTRAFHRAMSEYNEAEMAQRENCKSRIQRQAEIMCKEVTREQVDEMIETGKWSVFSDNLLLEGRSARSALTEIENRHKELLELEGRIRDIRELFFQMAVLVEQQSCMVDNIEVNVIQTQDYVAHAGAKIKKAVKYKQSHPCKKLFCCCFPCCR